MLFEDAVSKGEFSPVSAEIYAFGIYLMHGGDPDKFADLTQDQIQILLTAYTCTVRRFIDSFYKMFKAMAGVKD